MARPEIVPHVSVMFGVKPRKKATKAVVPEKAMPSAAPSPTWHEPTHAERMHNAAADEHVHAARKWVAGEISTKKFQETKRRAEKVMSTTPKQKR